MEAASSFERSGDFSTDRTVLCPTHIIPIGVKTSNHTSLENSVGTSAILTGFPSVLQVNTRTVTHFTSFPLPHSLIIPPFDAIEPEILTASLGTA
jgi:hypothetical protein